MIKIENVERRFLKIVGIGHNDENGRLFDMQDRNKTMQPDSTRYINGPSINKEYKTIYKYKNPGCRMEIIEAAEFVGEELHKKQTFRVIRDNVSYALERDLNNGAFAIYIVDSKDEDTDYRSDALGITTKLVKSCSKYSLETVISVESEVPIWITAKDNAISVLNGVRQEKGNDRLKLQYTRENYENTLAENINEFGSYGEGNRLNDLLQLLCNEIIEEVYTEAMKKESGKEEAVMLYDKREEFKDYSSNKNGQLNKCEESFLNSMGIEIDEFDYNFICSVLFDSDTAETYRYFGTRLINDVCGGIDTYALNGTIVDVAREIPDQFDDADYDKIKQNREVRVVRNDIESVLQYSIGNPPTITLHIGEPNVNYYNNHNSLSYYSSYDNVPYVKMSLLSDNRIFVSIGRAEEDKKVTFSFSAKKIYIDGKLPFTVENLQNCLVDKLQDIASPEIRDEFIYQLPLLSEVIPMTLIIDGVEKYSTCSCEHEIDECVGCKKGKIRATKLKELKLLLEKFNEHMISQAENKKNVARQKNIGETSSQN